MADNIPDNILYREPIENLPDNLLQVSNIRASAKEWIQYEDARVRMKYQ